MSLTLFGTTAVCFDRIQSKKVNFKFLIFIYLKVQKTTLEKIIINVDIYMYTQSIRQDD